MDGRHWWPELNSWLIASVQTIIKPKSDDQCRQHDRFIIAFLGMNHGINIKCQSIVVNGGIQERLVNLFHNIQKVNIFTTEDFTAQYVMRTIRQHCCGQARPSQSWRPKIWIWNRNWTMMSSRALCDLRIKPDEKIQLCQEKVAPHKMASLKLAIIGNYSSGIMRYGCNQVSIILHERPPDKVKRSPFKIISYPKKKER